MTAEIFTPKADDTNAAAHEVGTEYALVKSSGYLDRARVGENGLAYCLAYSQYNGGRVIVSRLIGTTEWNVVEQVAAPTETVEIPDTLPDDFA